MENVIIDNDEEEGIYIKEINGKKCLHYKLEYERITFLKDPTFVKWLNEQKDEIGEIDHIYMCRVCNIFVYYKGTDYKCCNHFNYITICLYCGSFYEIDNYCCLRRGLIEISSRYLLNGIYTCNLKDGEGILGCIKSIPFIFYLSFISTFYFGLFLHRKYKNIKAKFSSYGRKDTKFSHIAFNIGLMFILVISLVYSIQFIILYFIYLIIFFKNYSN